MIYENISLVSGEEKILISIGSYHTCETIQMDPHITGLKPGQIMIYPGRTAFITNSLCLVVDIIEAYDQAFYNDDKADIEFLKSYYYRVVSDSGKMFLLKENQFQK